MPNYTCDTVQKVSKKLVSGHWFGLGLFCHHYINVKMKEPSPWQLHKLLLLKKTMQYGCNAEKKLVNGSRFGIDLSYPQILKDILMSIYWENKYSYFKVFIDYSVLLKVDFLPGISAFLIWRGVLNSEFRCFSLTSSSSLTKLISSRIWLMKKYIHLNIQGSNNNKSK